MALTNEQEAKKRGRPPELIMPDPIPDTPENVARAIMRRPSKKQWRYLEPKSGAKRNS